MRGVPGIAAPARSARLVMRVAWRELLHVLAGSGPPSGRRWRSPSQRRVAYTALGAVTLLLCAASVASLADGHGLEPGFGAEVSTGSGAQSSFRVPASLVFRHPATASGPAQWLQGPLGGEQTTLLVLVALAVVMPVALAIRHPLLGWRIGWLALLGVPLLGLRWWGGLPWDPVQVLVLLVVLWTTGIRHGRAALCWLWALTLIPWWFWILRQGPDVVTAALGSAVLAAMAVAVDSVSSRLRTRQALADQAERARKLSRRARIARELHDVIAHHMSLIAVRAETAPYRLAGLPEPVRAEFGSLSESAREAMADMRRLLGILRNDEPVTRAPQPGLPDLPELIDTARQAGMTVELAAPGGLDRVPASAGVCAYRVIQEALSNAGRHAAGAPVTVAVHRDRQTVRLRVTNGPGIPAGPRGNGHAPGHGHGLAGMRERVELLGGSLSAGTAPGGGFAVSAVLPLNGSPA